MIDALHNMKQVQLKDAQENFEQLFENVVVSGEPVEILKETGNAILVSEEIWRGMIETLNLVSISGVRETIRAGMREPIANTKTSLDW
ncbi:MAG: type II toxin-antitoxin system Phd/YefM family antitoxin [Emcibacteraceae bacterium]|nr:type II toxin-antitoxin system Phd/YefM family antitoxin [Emcibacteraceae bacterium]